MLNLFRQGGLMKAFLGGIVLLIMAAFAFDFRQGSSTVKQECVVTVDDSCVDPKDYNLMSRLVGVPGMTSKALQKTGFTQHALNALVERELLLKEARRLGIGVSEDDIDAELALGRVHFSWPVDAPVPQAVFQGMPFPKAGAQETLTYIPVRNSKTNEFDFKVYRRQLQNLMRMSPKEFKKHQNDEVTAWRVRQTLVAPVRISEEEAFVAYEQQQSKVTARFAEARNPWFERFAVSLDAAAVDAYAKAHEADVNGAWDKVKEQWKEGCPLVHEIVFNYPADADAEQRATTSEAAQRALTLLKAGTSFEVVARASSEGAEAAFGGNLGCLNESSNAVAKDLLTAIATLEVGKTSALIETPKGLHILRLDGKVAADPALVGRGYVALKLASADKAKERANAFATQVIADVKAGKLITESVEARRKEYVVGTNGTDADPLLVAALDSVDVPKVDISRPVTRGTPAVIGLKDASSTQTLFGLEDGGVVDAPQATGLGVAILQLKEKDPATREAFDKDKEAILKNLTDQKRALILADYLARLKTQAKKIQVDQRYLSGTEDKGEEAPASDDSDNG
jgi:peptidyl-prolyl cis-trans isomerase D